jgi:hypothetical protein
MPRAPNFPAPRALARALQHARPVLSEYVKTRTSHRAQNRCDDYPRTDLGARVEREANSSPGS